MTPRSTSRTTDAAIIAALVVVSMAVSLNAMRGFRAAGLQPAFYQSNFEPAVMLACGRGFVTAPSPPQALVDFLNVARDGFDCSLLPSGMTELSVTTPANANWYYMYGAAAGIWKVTGISWIALDVLVCAMSAAGAGLLYGLFRLVSGPAISALFALLLTLSPANLSHLMSLRDYSKAPFVLAGVLALAVLLKQPRSLRAMIALAAAYGLVTGIGYGFRSDLAVMVPFGAAMVLLLLPRPDGAPIWRNAVAAAVLVGVFFLSAWPVIRGLQLGGCQYHFTLLGLTDPLTAEMRLSSPIYRFGQHLSDTFADLKTGDYSARVLGAGVPRLCTAEYDTASGDLYFLMARTFPADFVVRAYASVLMILRVGLAIPAAMVPMAPFASSGTMTAFYRVVSMISSPLSILGIVLAIAAMAASWAVSVRLGCAVTASILFLTGYPAIRFDERHWFHLRFIPWWALAMVATVAIQRGIKILDRPRLLRAAGGVGGTLAVLAAALIILRVIQSGNATTLIRAYESAAVESLATTPLDASSLRVDWQPGELAAEPFHRGSDLIVVALDPAACAGVDPIELTATYDADVPSRNMATSFTVPRPRAGAAPTRIFVPVFSQGMGDHTELKFSGLHLNGAPAACITSVSRIADRKALPLWIDLQVPSGWADLPLYQSMRAPRLFGR